MSSNDLEGGSEKDIERPFVTMASKHGFSETLHMGPPPQYKIDDDDTLAPRWYDLKRWGKKIWIAVAAIIAILIIIIVVAVVEVEKKNKYPDYSKVTYTVADTCLSLPIICPLCTNTS